MATTPDRDGSAPEEFQAANGRVTGMLVIAVAAVAVALALFDGPGGLGLAVGASALFLAVLAWAATLRPRIRLTEEHLVLHNMLRDVHLPLVAVEEMAVRQVLAVRVGERRFTSPVLGRSVRQTARGRAPDPEGPVTYVDFVEERIRVRVDDARSAAGVRRGSPEQRALADVRRETAWVPVVLLLVAAVAVVAALLG